MVHADHAVSTVEYSLRILVPADKASSYESWLTAHSQEVTNQKGFRSCQILKGSSLDHQDHVVFHVRYELANEDSFHAYLQGPAKKMRQEGVDMFGAFVTIQRDLVHIQQQLSHQGEP